MLLYGMVWFGLVGNGMVVKYKVWVWFGGKWYGRVVRAKPACRPQPPSLSSTFPLAPPRPTNKGSSEQEAKATLRGMTSKP